MMKIKEEDIHHFVKSISLPETQKFMGDYLESLKKK